VLDFDFGVVSIWDWHEPWVDVFLAWLVDSGFNKFPKVTLQIRNTLNCNICLCVCIDFIDMKIYMYIMQKYNTKSKIIWLTTCSKNAMDQDNGLLQCLNDRSIEVLLGEEGFLVLNDPIQCWINTRHLISCKIVVSCNVRSKLFKIHSR